MSLFSAKAVVVKKNVGIPVYALDWQDDTTIIASGGGGVGKSGVKNKLMVVRLEEPDDQVSKAKLDIVAEYILRSDEDAPMTLAVTSKGTIVTGINQSETSISEKSLNKHLRIFEVTSGKLLAKSQKQVFPISTPFSSEEYQHQTCFNRLVDPTLLATASTSGHLYILSFPGLEEVYTTKADGDIYSLDFSPADNDTILFVTQKKLQIVPFRDSKRVRLQNKKIFHELYEAALKGCSYDLQAPLTFRCARFISPTKVICGVNDRSAKKAYFQSYVLNMERGWRQLTPKQLPSRIKGIVGMDVSYSRRMIAVSTSDMAVNIFQMDTFANLLTVNQVAGFAITDIAFNPTGSYLSCSSVANSIAVIEVDKDLGRPFKEIVMDNLFTIIAFAMLILAILFFVLTSRR